MTRRAPIQVCHWLAAALLLLAPGWLRAQRWVEEEPRWLRLQIPETSVGLDAEGLRETVQSGGATSVHDNFLLVPLVGLDMNGSVYHPNLMSFDLNGQGGVGWTQDKVTSPGYSLTRNENNSLFRYLGTVNFLSGKPYNASFFAAQDHTYNNYDFFNTATVDSLRYGGRLAWSAKTFNLSSDMGYREQTATGLNGTSGITETYLNANGINQRETGNSTLSYNYDNFGNQLNYGPVQTSVSQSVAGSDTETFGGQVPITATTGASYGWAQYASQNAETFNATENVTVKHSPNLESFAALTYDDSQLDPSTSSLFQGIAGIRHQLYESLTSSFDVHGNYGQIDSPGTSGTNDRYGIGVHEDYTKRLGTWARLSLGGSAIVDHEDHDYSGDSIVTIINESHILRDTTQTLLNNPGVLAATIVVTGSNGVPVYANGVDYQVIPQGQMTQIQRLPTSLNLPNGTSVLVSYQSQSLYNSSFNSVNGALSLRLDLFNLVGVYGRLNTVDNDAPPTALEETLTDWVGGADVTWRWLRAGAEYEDFDSNFTQYKATRFFQSLSFQPTEQTTLGFNFNQIFYSYPDGQHQTQYQFIGTLNSQLRSWLSWNLEGGLYQQEAMGVSQNLAAARTGLNATWGKLSVKLGYQYNYQVTEQAERREGNYFYLLLKRVF
jgi:hypothetical protein